MNKKLIATLLCATMTMPIAFGTSALAQTQLSEQSLQKTEARFHCYSVEALGGNLQLNDLNNQGEAVGSLYSGWPDYSSQPVHILADGSFGDLGPLSNSAGGFNGINNHGAIVGYIETQSPSSPDNTRREAIIWEGGDNYLSFRSSDSNPGSGAELFRINDDYTAVGTVSKIGGFELPCSKPLVLRKDQSGQYGSSILPEFTCAEFSNFSTANAINEAGLVILNSSSFGFPSSGYSRVLNPVFGDESQALTNDPYQGMLYGNAMNTSGKVVGVQSQDPTSIGSAAVIEDENVFVISLPGLPFGSANGVNRSGAVVGTLYSDPQLPESRAFIQEAGEEAKLIDELLCSNSQNFSITEAQDINDSGMIIGQALRNGFAKAVRLKLVRR